MLIITWYVAARVLMIHDINQMQQRGGIRLLT